MPDSFARAYPRKRFFIDMFTRDISIIACVLDLIDNSIDGLVRSRRLDISRDLFGSSDMPSRAESLPVPSIEITFDKDSFVIKDNCGGISRKFAEQDAFNFGHAENDSTEEGHRQLGVYGIGLKRAIFKLGKYLEFSSRTPTEGFAISVDLQEWSRADDRLEDWQFPITYTESAEDAQDAGTEIRVTQLNEDVLHALRDPTLSNSLARTISETYFLFLDRYVTVRLQGKKIQPRPLPLGESGEIKYGLDQWEQDGVKTEILVGLASLGETGTWKDENAGWYILCNGRLIVPADKSELTGWDQPGAMPKYQPKYRAFVGLVFFSSSDPFKLPWTTTKRGLNRESQAFLRARPRMALAARPVITFLNSRYPSSSAGPDKVEKQLSGEMRSVDVSATVQGRLPLEPRKFQVSLKVREIPKTTKIQYSALNSDIDLVRTYFGNRAMSGKEIGEFTFQNFLKSEGLK